MSDIAPLLGNALGFASRLSHGDAIATTALLLEVIALCALLEWHERRKRSRRGAEPRRGRRG